MHQATKRINESAKIRTFTNKSGKTFKMDPEVAKNVAMRGGVVKSHSGHDFVTELLSALLDNFSGKEANAFLSKLMNAVSNDSFPHDIKISKDGSFDTKTVEWLS